MGNSPENDFQKLMSMARGFQPAKMLMVAVDLGVFDFLEEGKSGGEVAAAVKTNPRATGIFLNALTALGVLEKQGNRYHNGELASRYLVSTKEEYRGAIIKHLHHCYRGWANLGETVVLGHPPEVSPPLAESQRRLGKSTSNPHQTTVQAQRRLPIWNVPRP